MFLKDIVRVLSYRSKERMMLDWPKGGPLYDVIVWPFDREYPKSMGVFLHAWELELVSYHIAHRDRHSQFSGTVVSSICV